MPTLTHSATLAAIRATGCIAGYQDGEYRVTPPGKAAPAHTYYTTDRQDAIDTAKRMTAPAAPATLDNATLATWKGGEFGYCEVLVQSGGCREVPRDAVASYLRLQQSSARASNRMDVVRAFDALRARWDETALCCADCCKPLPGAYGTPGVSMARTRPGVLLCSDCGTKEALGDFAASQGFRGFR